MNFTVLSPIMYNNIEACIYYYNDNIKIALDASTPKIEIYQVQNYKKKKNNPKLDVQSLGHFRFVYPEYNRAKLDYRNRIAQFLRANYLGTAMKGEDVSRIRNSLQMSQERFAAVCCVSRVTIAKWENNSVTIDEVNGRFLKMLQNNK